MRRVLGAAVWCPDLRFLPALSSGAVAMKKFGVRIDDERQWMFCEGVCVCVVRARGPVRALTVRWPLGGVYAYSTACYRHIMRHCGLTTCVLHTLASKHQMKCARRICGNDGCDVRVSGASRCAPPCFCR